MHLADRAVIALSGPEARGFLQNLVSNDVEKVAPGRAIYAALLTPQGKIAFDFLVAEGDGALLLDTAAATQEALLKKLRLYRLRAKLEIEARDQLGVYAALSRHPDGRAAPYADRAVTFRDPRHPDLPARSLGARAEMPAALPGPNAYHALRLSLGVPEAADFGREAIFALDAGLEELCGVSFDKGCYVGQELTARMKHRATARKRLLAVRAPVLPAPGTALSVDGQEVGEIVSVYDTQGFALVRLDRLGAAAEAMAGNIPVALVRPAWLA